MRSHRRTPSALRSLAVAAAAAASVSCGLFRMRPPTYPPFTTGSGLVVQDLVLPSGQAVLPGDRVTVHYEARLESGEVFDSSYELGRPVTFAQGTGQVPPGVDEGVLGMSRGGRRRLTLAPDLAYGASGVPGRVPPNALVVFELEVLAIE